MVASLETDAVIDPVRASFDRVAEQYAADFADELTRKPWDVERLRRFAATCGPGPVLDVGCGSAGHVGRFVANLGARVVGVDFSERSVAHASRLNPTLRFVAGDARALPFAPGACAGVLAFYSLIYGGDEPTSAALAELRRVLRDGGRLLVAVHAGTGAQRFSEYKGAPVDVELHYRQPVAFAAQVRRAGFVVESVEVRPPYAFEHATERLYVTARAR
jgi:SAM-dependent methyltransferase